MKAKLVVLTGRAKGREIPLPSSQFVIGRKTECHLRPKSEKVSKLHCVIARNAGRLMVRDLKSRNGTMINGERIARPTPLNEGDVLSVGSLSFRVRIEEDDAAQVQAVNRQDVEWLMKSAQEFGINSDYETQVMQIPPDLLSPPDDEMGSESTELTAGEYLRQKIDDEQM